MKFTIKLPDRLAAALKARAGEMDMDEVTYLKHMLFAAAACPQGVMLQLDLPVIEKSGLPLFESAGVALDEGGTDGE